MSTTHVLAPAARAVADAEIRYEGVREQFAKAQADVRAAERRREELWPKADAAAQELYVLRATAEQERLLGAVAVELSTKIDAARLDVEQCDAQYSRATDAWMATLAASEETGYPAVQTDGSAFVDGSQSTAEPWPPRPAVAAELALTVVAREFADADLLAARLRLGDLEGQLQTRIAAAQAAEAGAQATARERRFRDRIFGGNGHGR
jgi:hypothetical protein